MSKTATATESTRRTIPVDNQPLTSADLRAIRAADEAFARGDCCTVDDLEADLKADAARLRPHETPKGSPTPSGLSWRFLFDIPPVVCDLFACRGARWSWRSRLRTGTQERAEIARAYRAMQRCMEEQHVADEDDNETA